MYCSKVMFLHIFFSQIRWCHSFTICSHVFIHFAAKTLALAPARTRALGALPFLSPEGLWVYGSGILKPGRLGNFPSVGAAILDEKTV